MRIFAGINDTVHSLIPTIRQHGELLSNHAQRIEALESGESGADGRQSIPTADLIIDNFPTSIESSFTPVALVNKLLDVLKIPHLKTDVLNARLFVKKTNSPTFSIIVSFKSNFTRDFIILTKRTHGKINQANLMGFNCGNDQIYVSEFSNSHTYKLLANAKKWKRDNGWVGFIWVQNSKILARKGSDRSSRPVEISSMQDLIQLA